MERAARHCVACDTRQGSRLARNSTAARAAAVVGRNLRRAARATSRSSTRKKTRKVNPVADDLATLALDMLVNEAGYQRAGPNLLLFGARSG